MSESVQIKYTAAKIKEFRIKRGLTQQDLAEIVEVGANTVSRWENAHYKPSSYELGLLSKILIVDINSFYPPEMKKDTAGIRMINVLAAVMTEQDLNQLIDFMEWKIYAQNRAYGKD